MRRYLVLLVLGIGGALALVLAVRHEWAARKDQERQAQELDRLGKKIERLQGQVAAVGTAAAVLGARGRAPAEPQEPAVPAVDLPAPQFAAEPPAPSRHRTAAEQAEIFRGYFASLDQLRGSTDDSALTGHMSEVLTSIRPEFASLRQGHLDLLRCGNGVCRIEMSFASAAEVSQAKTELLLQVGPQGGASTMYVDPARPHLFMYLAQPGIALPPFPTGPA